MPLPMNWIAFGLGIGYLFHNGTITLRGVAAVGAALAGGVVYLLWKYQENLLFQPKIFPQHLTPKDNPVGMRHPGEHSIPFEDLRLTAADGIKLHAWLLRPEDLEQRKTRPTILFFHENAGNMGLRMESLKVLYETLDVNILILSYRGYGESEGVPTEDGIYLDAEATYQYFKSRADLDPSRLIIMGRSLGGAVTIHLASKHEEDGGVSCVVIENTFASISDMVDVVFPYIAFAKAAILRMKWESVFKIRHITRPILFLSGAQDEIVPASQMKSLYSAATSSKDKEMVVFPNGSHNDTWQKGGAEYLARLRAFVNKHAVPGSAKAERKLGSSL